MLHDGWFWAFAIETILVLGVIGLIIYAVKTSGARSHPNPPEPIGQSRGIDRVEKFDVLADIGHLTGEVHVDFSRRVTGISVTPPSARHMANVLNEAADCAEGHVEFPKIPKQPLRPTAWDRIR